MKRELGNFTGEDSLNFSRLLRIKTEFLEIPVNAWSSNPGFQYGKDIVSNLCVVNDAAERGVKLCNDFLDSSKCESDFQNVLQVVENSRARLPNQRKRKLESKKWFLKLD